MRREPSGGRLPGLSGYPLYMSQMNLRLPDGLPEAWRRLAEARSLPGADREVSVRELARRLEA